ncbi:MAG: diaminopimelate epimerase [Oscillospiraceae bacterium]|nr:diaminopimelate epimerase [Oscillospiraceae bacterium]
MRFLKMQGAGNDFIVLDNRDLSIPETEYAALAADMCRRRLSVGADGLMVVLPPQEDGDIAMRFYNSDGTKGEMCGNGARCIARYAHDHGLSGDIQRIETTAGLVIGQRIEEDLYCVRLNDPSHLEPEIGILWEGQILSCFYVELGRPGIPHAVVPMENWDSIPRSELYALGKMIREYPAFPKGANVTFWRPLGRGHAKAITFERGVEDFTLACGTGAGSTALALRYLRIMEEDPIELDFPGGELLVSVVMEGNAVTDIYLTGPAVVVAEGEYIGK